MTRPAPPRLVAAGRLACAALALLTAAAAQAQDDRPTVEAMAAHVEAAPDDASARRALAARYTEVGEPEKAVPHLAWLAAQDPTDTDVLWTYARHLSWTDRGGEAVPVLDRIVTLDPDAAEARVLLAEAITWEGGAARAVELLAPLAASEPDDARVQRAYAYALHASGDERAARGQYTAALALDPDHAGMLLESGAIERWQGDWSLGQRRIRRALALGLDAEPARRARDLLDGLRREVAPTLTTTVERATDSNAITRVATPLQVSYTINSRVGVGLAVGWDRLSSSRALVKGEAGISPSAAATAFVPTLILTPRRGQRVAATVGGESVPGGGVALRVDVEAQRAWTGPFFHVFNARVSSQTGRDGVETLDQRIGVVRAAGTWYGEPRPWLGLGVEASGLRYGDGNTRFVASASGRARVAAWGTREEGRPALALALRAGTIYDDTRTIYPTSTPYYTPDALTTTSGGVLVEASPWRGVDLDVGAGAAHQNGPFPSTSLELHVRLGLDVGVHGLGLDIRRSGSDAYSVESMALRYTTRFL